MGQVTDCKSWRCPNCGELLEKGALGTIFVAGQPTDGILGSGTCLKCGASFPQADIYGGKYDFVGARPTKALPRDRVPTRISLVIFREGKAPPPDPERYCQKVVHERYGEPGPAVQAWRMVGRLDPPSAADAATQYAGLSKTGQLPNFGRPTDEFEGAGPDGNKIAVLFFWHASRRVPAEQPDAAVEPVTRKWWQFWKR